MNNLKVGDTLIIHCYKHNGVIYESSKLAYVIDIKDDYIVLGDENVLITKQDGKRWHTKGCSIMFFYKNRWFNIIAQIRDKGISYYCNMASPFVIDNYTLKYIDYDLDLKVFDNGAFKVLDRNEYNYHRRLMKYPKEINFIIKNELSALIEMKKSSVFPFNEESIKYYSDLFKKLRNEKQ